MSDVTVEISAGMQHSLAALVAQAGINAVVPVLLASAQVVRNAAIPKAAYLTGTLRRSIRTEPVGTDIVVGSDVPYARRIEFGFNGYDSLGRLYHQSARPYLRPAFDETKAEQLSEAKRATAILLARVLR
jgi:hypothetical protein